MDSTADRRFHLKKFLALCALLALLVPTLVLAEAKVVEAKLGKRIVDRTIADETTAFALGDKAFLWLKVEDAAGEALTVTWKVNDQAYPATLTIGGSPWRTWANKTLHSAGDWTVTVTDAAGATLSETSLTVK
jgi:hypothetical protein